MRTFTNSKFAISIMVILFTVSFSNCTIHTRTNRSTYKAKQLPPGQAKKIYGGKSAKRYAPGHNK
jgi:hypothetical protein